VSHPAEWAHGGYHEIQGKRRRNTILTLDVLAEAADAGSLAGLANAHRQWIDEALSSELRQRDESWTKSLAVGSEEFVLKTKEILGAQGRGRGAVMAGDSFTLREPQEIYVDNSGPKNRAIAPDNGFVWDDYL